MSDWFQPGPLLNPITEGVLTRWEVLAGPFGLLAFLPLIPVLLLIARWRRRTALILCGLVWIVATAGPAATLVWGGSMLAAGAWVLGLGSGRSGGRRARRSRDNLKRPAPSARA